MLVLERFYGTFEDLICLRLNFHCENGFTGHFQNGIFLIFNHYLQRGKFGGPEIQWEHY